MTHMSMPIFQRKDNTIIVVDATQVTPLKMCWGYATSMRFTFAIAGWEGSAYDNRILTEAIYDRTQNFPMPPNDKYYIVDAGYPNRKGFLAPYRNTRYHRSDFQCSQPRGKEETFNQMHSSLRNVIERAFGVLKMQWALLRKTGPYSLEKQARIVIVAMTLHNFIIDERNDVLVEQYNRTKIVDPTSREVANQTFLTNGEGSDKFTIAVVRD